MRWAPGDSSINDLVHFLKQYLGQEGSHDCGKDGAHRAVGDWVAVDSHLDRHTEEIAEQRGSLCSWKNVLKFNEKYLCRPLSINKRIEPIVIFQKRKQSKLFIIVFLYPATLGSIPSRPSTLFQNVID